MLFDKHAAELESACRSLDRDRHGIAGIRSNQFRIVTNFVRLDCPLACQNCTAIFSAIRPETEPNRRKTVLQRFRRQLNQPAGQLRAAGFMVRPPNITCAIWPSWPPTPDQFQGGYSRRIALHQEDMPSINSPAIGQLYPHASGDATRYTGRPASIELCRLPTCSRSNPDPPLLICIDYFHAGYNKQST